MTGSATILSSFLAKAVNARAAEAVDCEIPERSFNGCIPASGVIVRSSSLKPIDVDDEDSLARHFLSNRRQRSQESELVDQVHYTQISTKVTTWKEYRGYRVKWGDEVLFVLRRHILRIYFGLAVWLCGYGF